MADVERYVEDACEELDKVGCDTKLLSPEESLDYYEGIRSHCDMWIENINNDLEAADG